MPTLTGCMVFALPTDEVLPRLRRELLDGGFASMVLVVIVSRVGKSSGSLATGNFLILGSSHAIYGVCRAVKRTAVATLVG